MNSSNIETASSYINNLLLARGLLRNGQPLELAHPSRGEGGKEMTMARIVTLIHDLILRRDRETDTLTTLSQTLNSLKVTSSQQTQTISRLETRAADLERQLAQALAGEKAAKAAQAKAEGRNRLLREEAARLKGSVGQIRAQCANDVRKREGEIRRLQKHLEGKRGKDGMVGVTVVQPGAQCLNGGVNGYASGYGTVNEGYGVEGMGLQNEANAYLTQMAQVLGEENDGLTGLLRDTVSTLRNLQGLPESDIDLQRSSRDANDPDATTITTATAEGEADPNIAVSNPPTLAALASSLNFTLSHLKSLLTNPSFVPLEEVEVRDEEISRLRSGWDKMEARWREAIGLMNEWRARMSSGDTVDLKDLQKGLVLGNEEIVAPPSIRRRERTGTVRIQDESFVSDVSEISIPTPQQQREGEKDDEDTPQPSNTRTGLPRAVPTATVNKELSSKLGIGLFPAPHILQATAGNARRIATETYSPRKGQKAAVVRANSPQVQAMMDSLDSDNTFDELALLETLPSPTKKRRISQPDEAENALLDLLPSPQRQPLDSTPHPLPQEEDAADVDSEEDSPTPLTIEQKLALAQKEAEEAATALRAAITSTSSSTNPHEDSATNAEGSPSPPAPRPSSESPKKLPTTASPSKTKARDQHPEQQVPNEKAARISSGAILAAFGKPDEAKDASKGKENNPPSSPSKAAQEQKKPVKRTQLPKRTLKGGMKRSKRRSTLSPEELEGLVGL